jgi:hypothetical protein
MHWTICLSLFRRCQTPRDTHAPFCTYVFAPLWESIFLLHLYCKFLLIFTGKTKKVFWKWITRSLKYIFDVTSLFSWIETPWRLVVKNRRKPYRLMSVYHIGPRVYTTSQPRKTTVIFTTVRASNLILLDVFWSILTGSKFVWDKRCRIY